MLLHIITPAEWQQAVATGEYRPASLADEGFIHCSTLEQVLTPANSFYRGQAGLQLLCIDPALLKANLVYEDCYETGMQFPHIYGPLNLDAVINIVDFPVKPDGTFDQPQLD